MKTLTLDELNTLTNFNYARSAWNAEDTSTVKIEYDSEYQDFAVITAEKNVRKNRISKLQAEITSWAEGQLNSFKYQGKQVSVFNLTFENDLLGIGLVLAPQETAEAEPASI